MPYTIYSHDGRLVAQGFPDKSSAKIQAERMNLVGYKLLTHQEAYHRGR